MVVKQFETNAFHAGFEFVIFWQTCTFLVTLKNPLVLFDFWMILFFVVLMVFEKFKTNAFFIGFELFIFLHVLKTYCTEVAGCANMENHFGFDFLFA